MPNLKVSLLICFIASTLSACSEPKAPSNNAYLKVDALFNKIETNVSKNEGLDNILEIDHSRLGVKAGSVMQPARVLIFSDVVLDTELIQENPLTALELPLRILAFQDIKSGNEKIIYNSFGYIRSRFKLGQLDKIEKKYAKAITDATMGIAPDKIKHFANNEMQPDGILTITSPYDFATTKSKVLEAIATQDDAVSFGEVDFQARAFTVGTEIAPNTMILFGGPAPGAKAMSEAPTLGLDAFCQKFLLWQDKSGKTHLSFNDLLLLAERQDTNKSIALRVINYRLESLFEEALK